VVVAAWLTLVQVTLFMVRISFCLLRINLFWERLKIFCCTNKFRWRSPYCVASPAWSAANENKLGSPQHSLTRGSLLRVRLWWRRVCSALISIVQYFWFPVGSHSFLDRLFSGRCIHSSRPLCIVMVCELCLNIGSFHELLNNSGELLFNLVIDIVQQFGSIQKLFSTL
jgi:hypothetical protein